MVNTLIVTLFIVYLISDIKKTIGKIVQDNDNCEEIQFDHIAYYKDIIIRDLIKPNNLVIHKDTGILFFSHTIQNGSEIDFQIMTCHITNKVCNIVHGLRGGYAVAHDEGNDDIYLGGEDGIFRYNFLTKLAEFFSEENKSIWGLFIRKHFYYIEYPTQRLYIYEDDTFMPLIEASRMEVDLFHISKQNEIYIYNKTALYKIEIPGKYHFVLDDEHTFRQISEDSLGDIYFCGSDGIYAEMKPLHKLKKLANIMNAYGLAFDENDNVVYSDEHGIYKLTTKEENKECELI